MHAVNRDISSLTKKQRLKLLTLDAPELLAVTSGALKKNIVVNLLQVLTPLRTFLATDMVQQFYARSKDEDGETVSELLGERERAFIEYIHLKELLLSNYLVNLLFLMSMHVQSIPTRSHPVMKQLLELQYALQKMSVLDTKFQVDSVLLLDIAGKSKSSKKSSKTQQSAIETYFESARTEIVSNNACYRHESEEESNASDSDSNSDIDRQDENDLKSNSEDEYEAYVLNDEANMNGISSKKHRYYKTQSSSEEDESENDGILDLNGYNDSINTNSKLAKEQHKAKKQALKMSLEAFGGAYEKDVSSRKKCGVDDMVATIEPTLAKPTKLRRLENDRDDNEEYEWESHLSNKNKKGRKEGDSYEDGYDPVAMEKLRGALTSMYGDDGMASRQRRPVPSAVDEEQCAVDENSDDDQAALEIYEAFDGKKKAFLKKKKEHYKPEARYGSMFEMEAADVAKGFKNNKSSQKPVSDGAIKRAATYEMMKNKGLTPHRKKENRNPRVKKRIAYDKALVARRGQVREVNSTGVNTVSSYGGETTGIKSNLSRARKIST